MGFISTICYLFITGFVIQGLYRKRLKDKMKDAKYLFGLIIILTTWSLQILIYFDILSPMWLSTIFPWIPAQSGRTWMWNSWQFWQFAGANPSFVMPTGAGQIAVALALSYPLYYFFGIWLGKVTFGNKTYQRGAMWLFTPEKGEAPAPQLPGAGNE